MRWPAFPPIAPYATGALDVGAGHTLYWETCGAPEGRPALFLHGGPGGGCTADHRRLFDPARYRIVLFDQRGCARSTPLGRLEHNTTADLVADIERLRLAVGVERWAVVLGGSWGATLALCYALAHRDRVEALVLRGVFTGRRQETRWLYQEGAGALFPEAWDAFRAGVDAREGDDLVAAYHARLTQGDAQTQMRAAQAWCAWEGSLMTIAARPYAPTASEAVWALARIEAHYVRHHCFLEEGSILARAGALGDLPGVIVQGRYDMVTPATTAVALRRAWPGSKLVMAPDAGHAASEPAILAALIDATNSFA